MTEQKHSSIKSIDKQDSSTQVIDIVPEPNKRIIRKKVEQVSENVASVEPTPSPADELEHQFVAGSNPTSCEVPADSELLKRISEHKSFEVDGVIYHPHKYSIGDVVYIPKSYVKNVSDTFGPINAVQVTEPCRLTIASVVITNKVSYTFKETSKIIAAEPFVFRTEEACATYIKEAGCGQR